MKIRCDEFVLKNEQMITKAEGRFKDQQSEMRHLEVQSHTMRQELFQAQAAILEQSGTRAAGEVKSDTPVAEDELRRQLAELELERAGQVASLHTELDWANSELLAKQRDLDKLSSASSMSAKIPSWPGWESHPESAELEL